MVSKNAPSDIIASLPSEGMNRNDSFEDYVGSMSQSAKFDLGDASSSDDVPAEEPPLQRHSTGSMPPRKRRGEQQPIDHWSPKKSFLVS